MMKKLIIVLSILFISTNLYAAGSCLLIYKDDSKREHLKGTDEYDMVSGKGDIIVLYPLEKCIEAPYPGSPFFMIRLPDIEPHELNKYLLHEMDEVITDEMVKERLYGFDLTKIPAQILTELLTNVMKTVNRFSTIKNSIKNKKTDEYEITIITP